MKQTASQMVPILAILVLSVASHAIADDTPEKPIGQQVHLFEVKVRNQDGGGSGDLEDYNYRLLAIVLGSVEEARGATVETNPGIFSAVLTNNQARRLSKLPGVVSVRQKQW